MTFEFTKLKELDFDMKAETKPEGRRYVTPEGNAYPSVTTVLSSFNKKAIQEWRNRVGEEEAERVIKQSTDIGTAVHESIEKYLNGDEWDSFGEGFDQLLAKKITNKFVSHGLLGISEELLVAGRVDCIAEWNGQLSLV